jgi:pullulanase/glycogen debranching enzyme
MDTGSWSDPNAKVVGLLLSDPKTRLLLLINSYHQPIAFKLPPPDIASKWQLRVDSAAGKIDPPDRAFDPGQAVELPGRAAFFLAGTPA